MLTRLVLAAACALLPAMAGAQTLHATLSASHLSIDNPCARQVTVHADAAPGRIVLDATASHQAELDNLAFDGSDPARLHTRSGRCALSGMMGDAEPTLAVTLHVPPRSGLSVDDGGSATYDLDGPTGAFSLDGSGDLTVTAAQVEALTLHLSGSGAVRIGRATGPAQIESSGSAKVTIGQGDFPTLSVDSSGSGGLRVDSGTIGRIAVQGSGDAAVTIGGTVGGGAVELSGSGDVRIARATGPVTRDISGSGTLVIGAH